MIRRLRGRVIEREPGAVVIDVQGVGYLVSVSARASCMEGDEVDLLIHTQLRPDALVLFGFTERIELEIFDLLLSVQGVGPVKALAILESDPRDIAQRVRERDAVRLSKLPGIGKKTAERMVVDLYDKLAALSFGDAALPSTRPAASPAHQAERDLVSALINLGYKPVVAEQAAERALAQSGPAVPLERLLKDALAAVTRRSS